jgi:hypothetical protein
MGRVQPDGVELDTAVDHGPGDLFQCHVVCLGTRVHLQQRHFDVAVGLGGDNSGRPANVIAVVLDPCILKIGSHAAGIPAGRTFQTPEAYSAARTSAAARSPLVSAPSM